MRIRSLDTITEVRLLQDWCRKNLKAGMVLAGGAVRDAILGRPIKDLDVYVICEVSLPEWAYDFLTAKELYSEGDSEYDHMYIRKRTSHKVDGYDVDLIHMNGNYGKAAKDVVHEYSVALCKASIDCIGNVLLTDDFLFDAIREEITVYPRPWGEEGVKQHVDRLRIKYPWPVFIEKDGERVPYIR